MKQAAQFSVLLAFVVCGSLQIFLDPNNVPFLSTEDLNLEDVSDMNMSNEQKAELMSKFNSLDFDGANQIKLLTPDLAAPGDVTGINLNKTVHEVERTPNYELTRDHGIIKQIHTIRQPLTIQKANVALVQQDIKGSKQIVVVEPEALLPNIVKVNKDSVKLSAPSALNAPDVTVSPNGKRSMPTIDIPRMQKEVPRLHIEATPDVQMPQIEVERFHKDLPSLVVDPIESKELPSIQVPRLHKQVPSIQLPDTEDIEMANIGLPNMDREMADFQVPNSNPTLALANVPRTSDQFNDWDVNRVVQGDFSDFSVPDDQNNMENFHVPKARQGDMSFIFDDIRLPNVEEVAGPGLRDINVGDDSFHRLNVIDVENVAHKIYNPQVDNPEFNPLETIDVAAPGIPAFKFDAIAPLVEPNVYIPTVGLKIPVREPKQLQLHHELLLAKNQQKIRDHVVYVPNILLEEPDRIQMNRFPMVEPHNRKQNFIFPMVDCPPGLKPVKTIPVVEKIKGIPVVIFVPVFLLNKKQTVIPHKDVDVMVPEETNLPSILVDANVDPEDIVDSIIPDDINTGDDDGQEFVYDLSMLKTRDNAIAWEPNMFKGQQLFVRDANGVAKPYRISSKDLGDTIVGESRG